MSLLKELAKELEKVLKQQKEFEIEASKFLELRKKAILELQKMFQEDLESLKFIPPSEAIPFTLENVMGIANFSTDKQRKEYVRKMLKSLQQNNAIGSNYVRDTVMTFPVILADLMGFVASCAAKQPVILLDEIKERWKYKLAVKLGAYYLTLTLLENK